MKHLEMSLKSPTSGKLLLHTNLTPHPRKQAQAVQWLERMGFNAYSRAFALAGVEDGSQIWDAFSVISELKEQVTLSAFEANIEWSSLAIQVSERILAGLPGFNPDATEDESPVAQSRLAPLQLLYGIYDIRFTRQDTPESRENFMRIRSELAVCLYTLSESGQLEALLRAHREFNNAPLWRILIDVQISFGWKKEAAKSCVRMAQFADSVNMPDIAAASREEALSIDPNVKLDGTDFQTMTFMTKEELRLATREEIVGSFLRDPLHQDNYEHLVDFLEDEGAIVNAVRVVVAHSLTKNVPTQYQAATALPLRRLVTLVAHLQAKYIPQLQILSTEANNHRAQLGQEKINPPDLQSLLLQAHREEEYRTVTVNLLDTIAKKIAPPQASGSQPVPFMSQQGSQSPPGSPGSPTSSAQPLSALTHAQRQAQLRASWGIKPGVGKDLRNKRFTMGLKTSGPVQSSSPDSGFFGSRANIGAAGDMPAFGRPQAGIGGGRSSNFVPVENPIFSQPLDLPSRLHTPSVLTPFDADAFQQQFGVPPPYIPGQQPLMNPMNPMNPMLMNPDAKKEFLAADDSPFSSTVFQTLPEQLGSNSPQQQPHQQPYQQPYQQTQGFSSPFESEPQSTTTTLGTASLSSSSVSVNSSGFAPSTASSLQPNSGLSLADLDDPLAEVLALTEGIGRQLDAQPPAYTGTEDDMPPPPPEEMETAQPFQPHQPQPMTHAQPSMLPQAQSLLPPQQPLQPFGAPSPQLTSVFTSPPVDYSAHILAPAAHLAIHSAPQTRSPSPLTGMMLSGLLPPTSMALGGYGGTMAPAPTSHSSLSNPAILTAPALSNPGANATGVGAGYGAGGLPPGARLSIQTTPAFTPYSPPAVSAAPGGPAGSPSNWSGLLPPSSPLVNPALTSPTGTPSNPGLMSPPAY